MIVPVTLNEAPTLPVSWAQQVPSIELGDYNIYVPRTEWLLSDYSLADNFGAVSISVQSKQKTTWQKGEFSTASEHLDIEIDV